jgi:hypothetical protein
VHVPAPEPVAVAPAATPKPAAEPAPVAAPDPVLAVAAKISKEPVIVDYVPEPIAVAPKGTPLCDPTGKLRGYLRPDGLFSAVAEEADPLANLKESDRAPVIPEDESRVDLPQRSAGRISFLTATYESEREDPAYPARLKARLANDLARNLHARPASIFDPEKTPAAESIKKWIQ